MPTSGSAATVFNIRRRIDPNIIDSVRGYGYGAGLELVPVKSR